MSRGKKTEKEKKKSSAVVEVSYKANMIIGFLKIAERVWLRNRTFVSEDHLIFSPL